MSLKNNDSKNPWFNFIDNSIKISKESAILYGLSCVECSVCFFVIIDTSYQQKHCGGRYCQDCYNKLAAKYYCNICKIDDPGNFVHDKNNMYLDNGLKKDLEKHTFNCPDCDLKISIIQIKEHVGKCIKGWTLCGNCNEVTRKNLINHKCDKSKSNDKSLVEKKCSSCGMECENPKDHDVKCSMNWKKGTCPYGCNICESDHRENKFLYHMDKTWAILQSFGLTEMSTKDSPKYDKLIVPIADEVKNYLGLNNDLLKKLEENVNSLKMTIDEEKKIYEEFKVSLKNQINISLTTSFDGTILWRIDNFEKVKTNAASGKEKSLFSPPFYTSRFGYKLCLRLYPNGDSTAWGNAMSLFLVIMKGNYDALLEWPFKQKVTFILLDQQFTSHMIDAFVPASGSASFGRPRNDMNLPTGSSYFIKFDDLKTKKYVKEDTIFIRCIIDCSDLHE